jgi:hypothetical protein
LFSADQPLKSKVIRNTVRLLLRIDPPNIIEAEKLMHEQHCLELTQGNISRSTILLKMKISLLRGLHEEALRLAKFLLSEDEPVIRIEADIEVISSILEMDMKKQLPDVGSTCKLNMWSGLCKYVHITFFKFCMIRLHMERFRSFSRIEIQFQLCMCRRTSIFDFSAHFLHFQFNCYRQNDFSRGTISHISILF